MSVRPAEHRFVPLRIGYKYAELRVLPSPSTSVFWALGRCSCDFRVESKAAVHTYDRFPVAFSSSPGPSLRCPFWRSANRHHIYAPPFRCAGRQRARVTAQSIQQLGLPGESSEVGISLSRSLPLSLSLSSPPSRSLSLPFSLLHVGAEREEEGNARADNWREPQRARRHVWVRAHHNRC